MTVSLPIPAAQYLRMSTEHQQYSAENQAHCNEQYARSHGFTITRTYRDSAKSGRYGDLSPIETCPPDSGATLISLSEM